MPLWGLQYGKYHRGTDRRGVDDAARSNDARFREKKKTLTHYKIHERLSNTTVTFEITHSLEFVHLAVFKIENNWVPDRPRPLTKVQRRPIRFLNVSLHILQAGWTSPNSESFPVWNTTVRTLWNCITKKPFTLVLFFCYFLFITRYNSLGFWIPTRCTIRSIISELGQPSATRIQRQAGSEHTRLTVRAGMSYQIVHLQDFKLQLCKRASDTHSSPHQTGI